jgi:hypothetical protein
VVGDGPNLPRFLPRLKRLGFSSDLDSAGHRGGTRRYELQELLHFVTHHGDPFGVTPIDLIEQVVVSLAAQIVVPRQAFVELMSIYPTDIPVLNKTSHGVHFPHLVRNEPGNPAHSLAAGYYWRFGELCPGLAGFRNDVTAEHDQSSADDGIP